MAVPHNSLCRRCLHIDITSANVFKWRWLDSRLITALIKTGLIHYRWLSADIVLKWRFEIAFRPLLSLDRRGFI